MGYRIHNAGVALQEHADNSQGFIGFLAQEIAEGRTRAPLFFEVLILLEEAAIAYPKAWVCRRVGGFLVKHFEGPGNIPSDPAIGESNPVPPSVDENIPPPVS